jgi:hypothetical protein
VNKEDEPFRTNTLKWIKRPRSHLMNGTYFEGSMKGNLWLRDIHNESELKIPTDFQDKVKEIHYDGAKNLLFVSSKDGRLKCWKLPNTWNNNALDEIKQDTDFSEKFNLMVQGKIKRNHE